MFTRAALAAWLVLICGTTQAAGQDLAIVNANIITVDPTQPRVQAALIRDGRFVAVGSNEAIRAQAGRSISILDLAGRTVLPGFIDSYLHPRPEYGADSPFETIALGPEVVADMSELIAALQKRARATPKGTTIVGRGYQDTKLGRHPNRHDLDQASTDHPILITHSSGHLSVANSRALEMAGITRATVDPAGGAFDREADGTPTGDIYRWGRGFHKAVITPHTKLHT